METNSVKATTTVAPLKPLFKPRLELQAILREAKLENLFKEVFTFFKYITNLYSKIVCCWIR